MPKLKRSYSRKTLKKLFALSGNRCAYPECTFPIIGPATEKSDDIVIGEICHIYAVSEDGPRGKSGLGQKDLNSPENLILLCRNHHKIVDGQHETYPAEKLVEWKRKHEAKIKKHPDDADSDSSSRFQDLTKLVDGEIEKEVDILRKSRFFEEFNSDSVSLKLAKDLVEGKFRWGTDLARSRALAWCVRFLSRTEELETVEEYLTVAKNLDICDEVRIAEAFVLSRKKEKGNALKILKGIDSSMSRSAAFMIVSHHKGLQGAIDWLISAYTDPESLDSDGKYYLLAFQLELEDWDKARESLDVVSDEDLRQAAPALHYMMGATHLSMAVPKGLRAALIKRPPLEEVEFHLASDAEAVRERRKAREHFIKAATLAENLNCSGVAKMCEEYALWLELSDPEILEEGKRRLENNLRGPEPDIHLVRLAVRFGINLDTQAVEKEIERQKALNGEITYNASRARLGLVFKKAKENLIKDAADYIDRYEDDIVRCLDRKSVQVLKIGMLSGAGQLERATKCLAALKEEGLSGTEYEDVRRLILEAGESDQVGVQKRRFEETDSLNDLIILVKELLVAGQWDEACEYGRVLFERTNGLSEAEELAKALIGAGRNGQLVEFIRANMSLLEQPNGNNLKMLYCAALYREGELLEARSVLENLDCDPNDATYRELKLHLAISRGDEDELSAIVSNELLERGNRSPLDLLKIAGIAAQLGLPGVKKLTVAAAEKSGKDVEKPTAEMLAAAYHLASKSGWEDDPTAQEWLEEAMSLSGEEGPIRQISLKDALDQQLEWNRHKSENLRRLSRGDVPMFVAAQSLNQSLVDFTLFPALKNQSQTDLRRKAAIPAYCGNRPPKPVDVDGTVGIDASALLTLSFLGLLDKALDAFDAVYVPHSTLAWLFEEKGKAKFHQPSRIKDARKVANLIANGTLEKLEPVVIPDRDLSDQVGDGLATLIAEAEESRRHEEPRQVAVVRSAPVSRVDSLMDEEADLKAHADVLRSCRSVIGTLRKGGHITDETANKAHDYLKLAGEKPWPGEHGLADGAILYLDSLSVAYFLRLGVLEKLRMAGFRSFVSPRTVSEATAFLSYENISDEINGTLESLRSALNSRIEEGKIKVARQLDIDGPEDQLQSLYRHPTASAPALSDYCDAVVADDRFINRNTQASISSTLDILDALASSKHIKYEEKLDYRNRLRKAGYFFIPVNEDELKFHLENSEVQDGKLVERPGLKAIRENVLQVQMSGWLRLPEELFWAYMSFTSFVKVLRGLWTADADLAAARVRSDWVVDRTNIIGWLQNIYRRSRNAASDIGFESHLMIMLLPSTETGGKRVEMEYWEWFQQRILRPMKEQHADLYSWVAKYYKKEISKYEGAYLEEMKAKTDGAYNKTALAKDALDTVPPMLRDTLLADHVFRRKYGIKADPVVSFEYPKLSVRGSEMFNAVRKILSGTPAEKMTDTDGREWELKNESAQGRIPSMEASRGGERFTLPSTFVSLSPDMETRLRFLEEAATDLGLPDDAKDSWREILERRALEDHEVEEFGGDLLDTPAYVEKLIRGKVAEGQPFVRHFVPSSRRYFDRLVGRYDGSNTVRDYASGSGRMLFRELSSRNPYNGFLSSLLLSSHSFLTDEIQVVGLMEDDFIHACEFLEKTKDRVSQLGAIEVGLRVLPSMPGVEPCLVSLIKQLRNDDIGEATSGFRLLSTLFVWINGELSSIRLFPSEPPFYRRLAALSQAALVHRQLADSSINIDSLGRLLIDYGEGAHLLQSLVDMRMEPCWSPAVETARELQWNFFGRVMTATDKYRQNVRSEELLQATESVRDTLPFPFCFPGPMDGTGESLQDLPAERAEAIRMQTGEEKVSPSSFIALSNSTLFFHLEPAHAELATRTLKTCSHQLSNIEDGMQLLVMLNGLAKVAAVTRSSKLADELRIIARRYRSDAQYPIPTGRETMVCLLAAASRESLKDWTEFIGDWITELAFLDELEKDEINMLYSQLQYLCHAVPELWVTCDRACAALIASGATMLEPEAVASVKT